MDINEFVELIEPYDPEVILEIGCDTGINELCPDINVISIDAHCKGIDIRTIDVIIIDGDNVLSTLHSLGSLYDVKVIYVKSNVTQDVKNVITNNNFIPLIKDEVWIRIVY